MRYENTFVPNAIYTYFFTGRLFSELVMFSFCCKNSKFISVILLATMLNIFSKIFSTFEHRKNIIYSEKKRHFELIFSFLLCFYRTYMSNKIESDNIELNYLQVVLPILLLLESEESHRPTWKESYKQLYSDLQVPLFNSGFFILTTLKN